MSTLNTINNPGNLYADQGTMEEAEVMFWRALKRKEEAWGPKHTSVMDTVNSLGTLYRVQGKKRTLGLCICGHWQATRRHED